MNRAGIVGLVTLLALAAGAAAWMLSSDPELKDETTRQDGAQPVVTGAAPVPGIKPIEAAPYTGAGESGRLGGDPALRVVGVVQGRDGLGIASATVDLIEDRSPFGTIPLEGRVLASVTTLGSGTFTFVGIDEGANYVLRASHPGYATARVHPVSTRYPDSTYRILVLEEGFRITGRVLSFSRDPITAARVQVVDLQTVDSERNHLIEREVVCDADGGFELAGLSPGTKRLVAHADGYASDGHALLTVGADAPLEFLEILLPKGSSLTGTLLDGVSGAPVANGWVIGRPVSSLPRGGEEGILSPTPAGISDEGEEPLTERGAGVARQPLGNDPFSSKGHLQVMARTDQDGRFELQGLHEAVYSLRGFAEGYDPSLPRTAGPGLDVRLEVNRRAVFEGRVVDEQGNPVTTFALAVSRNGEHASVTPDERQTFQDRDGRFSLGDVPQGDHYLLAFAEGVGVGRAGPFRVLRGERKAGIEVLVERGASLRGRIMDGAGQPVAGADVRVSTVRVSGPPNPFTDAIRSQLAQRWPGPRVRTQPDGTFEFAGLAPGAWRVTVEHPTLIVPPSEAVTVTAGEDRTLPDLVGVLGGTVEGVVLTGSREADPAASVLIRPVAGSLSQSVSVNTMPDGTFRFDKLAEGSYHLLVTRRENRSRLEMLLDITEGRGKPVTVRAGMVVQVTLAE